MKITGASISLLPPRGDREPSCLLELRAGEHIGTAIGSATIHDHARHVVDELLLDADPRAVTMLWQKMAAANARTNGALASTIAALDIAIWDLKARLNDEPLWRTLGGLRPRANAHLRVAVNSDDELGRWCRTASPTTRGIVLASSGDADIDARRLRRIRDSLANADFDCELMLDAGEQWTPKEAIRAIAQIEASVDLAWIEAPTARGDFLGHKRIVDAIRGGVCAGGRFASTDEFLPHLHHHSLSVVQIAVCRTGITAALQIADAAYGFELPIALTRSPGNIHAHLAASLPYCATIEIDENAESSDIRIEQGWVIGGDRPGHGAVFHP